MIKVLCFLFVFSVLVITVFASNSTVENSTSSTAIEESRRRKHHLFGSEIWWWGPLKALSVFITIKIKIILLLLFVAGSIFYGFKIWQGTALGCPEPIIQESHSDHILPYSAYAGDHSSIISSYPGGPPSGSGLSGYSGPTYSNYPDSSSYSGYSNTPSSYPSASAASYPSPSESTYSAPPPSAQDASGQNSAGYPYSNRRTSKQKRSAPEEAVSTDSNDAANNFTELIFQFLGVDTLDCRKRFVCELGFRNPFMGFAIDYISDKYKPAKDEPKPKNFRDCAKLYQSCKAPGEESIEHVQKKKKKLKATNASTTDQTARYV